jgi:hypothetical protein
MTSRKLDVDMEYVSISWLTSLFCSFDAELEETSLSRHLSATEAAKQKLTLRRKRMLFE